MSEGKCQEPECDNPIKSRGWCQMHYFRFRRHGNPNVTMIDPWTDDELEVIRRTTNLTAKEVMRYVNRSWHTVRSMRAQLSHDEGISFEKSPSANDPHCVGRRRLLAKTCLGCGLLLDAKWFTTVDSNLWSSRCTRCVTSDPRHRERTKRSNAAVDKTDYNHKFAEKMRELTLPHASRRGYPWLDTDHVVLRDSTLSNFEKAMKLGRTYAATCTAVSKYGYTSRVGKGDPMLGVWHISNPNEMEQAS